MASPIAPVIIDLKIGGFQGVKQALNDVVRIVDDMNKSTIRSTDKAAKDRVRSEAQAAKEVAKLAQQEAKEKVKAAKEAASATDRIASDEIRKQEGYARNRERIVQNSLRYEQRLREQAARDEDATQKRLQASRERRATRIGGAVGGAVGRGIGVLGRVAGFAASIGGGFAIADALQEGISEEAAAGQIVRSSGNTGGVTKAEVLAKTKAAALATGGKSDDMLGGINTFIEKSGDLKGAMDMLEELSKLAALTGAHMEDLGYTAGDALNKITAAGSKDAIGDTTKVMRMLGGQARTGAIDIRELGEYGPRLTASAGMFKGDVAENVGTMGSLAQIAVKLGGAHNARVGTQAVASLAEDIAKKSGDFESLLGFDKVWADKDRHKMQSAESILMAFTEKTKGDQSKVSEYFGKESGFIERGFGKAYNSGYMGVRGRAGMEKAFGEIRGATLITEQMDEGVTDKLGEIQSKINIARRNFQTAIDEKLLPKMPELIDSFTKLIPAITKFIELIVEHPYGAIISAAIVSSIGGSGLGAIVATAVKAMVLGQSPIMPPGGGGPLPSPGGIPLINPVTLAGGAYFGGRYLEEKASEASVDVMKSQLARGKSMNELIGSAKDSSLSNEQRQANLARLKELSAEGSEFEGRGKLGNLGLAAKQAVTGDTAGQAKFLEAQQAAAMQQRIQDAIALIATALETGAQNLNTGGDGRASPADPSRGPIQVGR